MTNIISIRKEKNVTIKWFTAGETHNKMQFTMGLTGYVREIVLVKWPLLKPTVYRLSCCEILIH